MARDRNVQREEEEKCVLPVTKNKGDERDEMKEEKAGGEEGGGKGGRGSHLSVTTAPLNQATWTHLAQQHEQA